MAPAYRVPKASVYSAYSGSIASMIACCFAGLTSSASKAK